MLLTGENARAVVGRVKEKITEIEKTLPEKDTPIVLYCGGGFRSALAADNLQKMGYTNVTSLDGGWRGWTERGLPTVTPEN